MGLSLTELIRRVGGDEAIVWQNLLDSLHGATTNKRTGVTELRFGTREITPSEIATGANRKEALVLWIDKAAMRRAIDDWTREPGRQP